MSKNMVSVAELKVVGNMQMNGTMNPTIQIWRQSTNYLNESNNHAVYFLQCHI